MKINLTNEIRYAKVIKERGGIMKKNWFMILKAISKKRDAKRKNEMVQAFIDFKADMDNIMSDLTDVLNDKEISLTNDIKHNILNKATVLRCKIMVIMLDRNKQEV